ncbi:hypothetical protein LLH00_00635 [bacterium]|nr:hypothetical protein [bacterium]
MSDVSRETILARIAALTEQKQRAVTAYQDKEAEITAATQELSNRIRALRQERGAFALEASACQQKIDEIRGLLNDTGAE